MIKLITVLAALLSFLFVVLIVPLNGSFWDNIKEYAKDSWHLLVLTLKTNDPDALTWYTDTPEWKKKALKYYAEYGADGVVMSESNFIRYVKSIHDNTQ